MVGQSDPLFVPTSSLMKTPTIYDYWKNTKNDRKGEESQAQLSEMTTWGVAHYALLSGWRGTDVTWLTDSTCDAGAV